MGTKTQKSLDLTTGSVTKQLLLFALPLLVSNVLQTLYNSADKMVVGKFAVDGDTALAAVGATSSAINLILNLFIGLGVGVNVIVANQRGAGAKKSMRRTMHTAIPLAALSGAFVMLLGIVIAEPFLLLMGAPKTVLDQATLYMRIYFVGVPFSLIYNFGSAILRAHGDTRRPMIILALSGLLNVGLNLFFVIICGMAVDGVAWATVASQAASAAAVLWCLMDSKGEFGMKLREMKLHWEDVGAIARVGIPCGLNSCMFSIANVIIQSTVNSMGAVVVAGGAAADGYNSIVNQVMASFSAACVSFAGQCYGAKRYRRIDEVMLKCLLLSESLILGLSLVATVFPDAIMSLFTDDPDVIKAAIPKMMTNCWGYMIYAVCDMFVAALRGMKRSTMPMVVSMVSICAPRIIWVLAFFPMCQKVWFLYLCYPISWTISAVCQGAYFFHVRRQVRAQGDETMDSVTA